MANSKAPDTIQKQFNKIQHKLGEAVFFTWLGSKKYGYVIETKERNWGIQYTVESEGTRYPCGIQIKSHKTAYTTGCINYDETRSLGQQELVTRIQTGHSSTYSELFIDSRGATIQSRRNDTAVNYISTKNNKRIKSARSENKSKNTIESSNDGMLKTARGKRKNNELDTAIQRQRDFLNGFIKQS